MTAITIDRLTVRLVRHGGWGWGADRQALVEAVKRLLPWLLERIAAQLADSAEDLELTAPLRLSLRMKTPELLGAARALASAEPGREPAELSALVAQLARSLAREPVAATPATPATATFAVPEPGLKSADAPPEPSEPDEAQAGTMLRVLLRFRASGELQWFLSTLSSELLLHWQCLLLQSWSVLQDALPQTAPTAASAATSAAAEVFSADSDLDTVRGILTGMRHSAPAATPAAALSLLLILEVIGQKLRISAPMLRSVLLDAQLGVPAPTSPAPPASDEEIRAANRLPGEHRPLAPTGRLPQELAVRSVLPFLLLRPLSQIGYLEVLDGVLQAERATAYWPAIAVGLAYKVLSPPEHGWRRNPADLLAAMALAGGQPIEPDEALSDAAELIGRSLAAADRALTSALLRGHKAGTPLFLSVFANAQDKTYLLIEPDGLFVVACCQTPRQVCELLAVHPSPLLLPMSAALPEVLAALLAHQVDFITTAPPGRAEPLRPLRLGPTQLWTNLRAGTGPPWLQQAEQMSTLESAAAALFQALAIDRVAIPRARASALERSLTVAAAVALADAAWRMWPAHPQVGPLTMLERMHDLDGRVIFGADAVRVKLPLGRRFHDLSRGGLLAEIRGVPFLGGRPLCFQEG